MPRSFRLREERMVRRGRFPAGGLQRAGAAAESKRVDGQDGDFGVDIVALIAGEL